MGFSLSLKSLFGGGVQLCLFTFLAFSNHLFQYIYGYFSSFLSSLFAPFDAHQFALYFKSNHFAFVILVLVSACACINLFCFQFTRMEGKKKLTIYYFEIKNLSIFVGGQCLNSFQHYTRYVRRCAKQIQFIIIVFCISSNLPVFLKFGFLSLLLFFITSPQF